MATMRALLPDRLDDVDIHEHYARDWVAQGGIRVDMVSSMDGAATADGLTAGLQTPADNRVFAALRDLADAVLVGAHTVRQEGYAPIRLDDARRAVRQRYGFADVLTTVVLSRRLDFDPAAALFAGAGPGAPTVVLTCAAAPEETRSALARTVDVIVCGDLAVDFGLARAALAERGLTRLLCEGGPTTFAELVAAEEWDELCLSLTPLLAGPGPQRIVAGLPWPGDPRPVRMTGLLEEDGALFLRLAPR